jgi:hypothetical protein
LLWCQDQYQSSTPGSSDPSLQANRVREVVRRHHSSVSPGSSHLERELDSGCSLRYQPFRDEVGHKCTCKVNSNTLATY